MGVFEDLGVMVDGLETDDAEEYGGEVEEIFRFDVYISPEHEIEIGVNMQELEIEGYPEFGEEYGLLAHTFAQLVTEHVGMETACLMEQVGALPEMFVELTPEEESALEENIVNENGAVLMYSFPVLIMEEDEEDCFCEKKLGAGFKKTAKAEVLQKVYGEAFAQAEDVYREDVTDAVLDHGLLFLKAVEAIQKL